MREPADVFHLAVPVRDLDEAVEFYCGKLGCHLARRYEDRVTFDFFGDQLVCHLSEGWERSPSSLYPRHFGITFRRWEDFEAVHALAKARQIPFFAALQPRFSGLPEEHDTFVLVDPSGNLIEFKHYHDHRMMH